MGGENFWCPDWSMHIGMLIWLLIRWSICWPLMLLIHSWEPERKPGRLFCGVLRRSGMRGDRYSDWKGRSMREHCRDRVFILVGRLFPKQADMPIFVWYTISLSLSIVAAWLIPRKSGLLSSPTGWMPWSSLRGITCVWVRVRSSWWQAEGSLRCMTSWKMCSISKMNCMRR